MGFRKGLFVFAKTAKFLNLAFSKIKRKRKIRLVLIRKLSLIFRNTFHIQNPKQKVNVLISAFYSLTILIKSVKIKHDY